jgi:RIO-like serine/threonine protein kinase
VNGATLLKRGRLAATEKIEFHGEPAVRKTLRMSPRIPGLSGDFDRWLAAREVRQLRRAEGIAGIPRVLSCPAPNVYVREFLAGTALPRAPTPPGAFFDELRAIVLALHERGITHNDLHKEANVIVKGDGRPGLIDFQLSLSPPPGSELFRLLARFDLYHVAKNRRHRTGEPLQGEEAELFRRTQALRRMHRGLVKKPMNLLTRRLFPRALGKLPTDTDP